MWFKILAWIQRKSKAAVKQNYRGANVKCPNCHRWHSEMVADKNYPEIVSTEDGFDYFCSCCGNVSSWNSCIAPVAILIKAGK